MAQEIISLVSIASASDPSVKLMIFEVCPTSIRIKQNPAFYSNIALETEAAGEDENGIQHYEELSPDERLERFVEKSLQRLVDEGLVEDEETEITATAYGNILCKHCIRFPTFLQLKDMPGKASVRTLVSWETLSPYHASSSVRVLIRVPMQLEQLAQAQEFQEIRFRAGEKGAYTDINKREEIRFPLEKVAEPHDKVNLLIQVRWCDPASCLLRRKRVH